LLEPLDSFDAVRGGRPVARLDPVKRSYPLAVSTWFRNEMDGGDFMPARASPPPPPPRPAPRPPAGGGTDFSQRD